LKQIRIQKFEKEKEKEMRKRIKGRGRCFGPEAKASPARHLPEPNRYAAPQRSH
jgi:hypothetical protein